MVDDTLLTIGILLMVAGAQLILYVLLLLTDYVHDVVIDNTGEHGDEM